MLPKVSEPQGPHLYVVQGLQHCPAPSHLLQESDDGASLVVKWLRVCLPMQGTQVRALVWEDPTCRGATRPVSHNC